MNLSPQHIHLLLNHFPTIGFIVGLSIFVAALIAKSDDLKRAGLTIFVAIAFLTIPTYLTGNAAQSAVENSAGVSKTLIETHEGAAFLALIFMELTGAVAWYGLWRYRRTRRLLTRNLTAVLLLSFVTLGLVSRAANIGGEIRHPEIRAAQETVTIEGAIARDVGTFITERPWVWPAAETLHFIGLTLLLGVVLLVNLRMLGVMKNVSVAALDRMVPWGVVGFGLNLITGMLFFVAAADQYTANSAFLWKVILMMLAGANAVYFTIFDKSWRLEPGADATPFSKVMAGSALALWIGVMYYGSMLPFIGNAF